MSRITGTDAANLIEAYNSLYAPQEEVELTEEQVQEDFENWVNSLVEEGHDLSEYTWEDMYEHYLNEAPIRYSTGPTAADLQRQRAQASPRPAPTPSRPIRYSTGPTAADLQRQRAQASAAPYQSRFAGARDAAVARARQIQGSPVVGPRPTAQAPARPAATSARPAATSARPATAPASPRPAAPSTATTGFQLARQGVDLSKPSTAPAKPANPQMSGMPSVPSMAAPAGGPKLSARAQALKAGGPQGGARARVLNQDLDLFDIVKGYLIDEGYAETEEAAAVIMANMSDEWRQSIVDSSI